MRRPYGLSMIVCWFTGRPYTGRKLIGWLSVAQRYWTACVRYLWATGVHAVNSLPV